MRFCGSQTCQMCQIRIFDRLDFRDASAINTGDDAAFKKQWFLIGPKGPNVADPALKSKLFYLN